MRPPSNESDRGIAFCTIFTRSHLARAVCLARSLRAVHPGATIYALLVDRGPGELEPAPLPFEIVDLESLHVPDLDRMLFGYSPMEMCCACKPYLVEYLLRQLRYEKVMFFDSDILVLGSLDIAIERLEHSSILLTPHATRPVPADGKQPDELRLLRSGAFNAGFIGVSGRPEGERFVAWWSERLSRQCVVDTGRGLYLDQKFLDLVPAYFEELSVLRDPGYNVAYWNLHERPVTCVSGRYLVGGTRPLAFFHFSGFDPDQPGSISRYQDRFAMADIRDAAGLFSTYADMLATSSHADTRSIPYAFDTFSDGTPIPGVIRSCFRRSGSAWTATRSPFDPAGPDSFLSFCLSPPPGDDGLPPLFREILTLRPDVQRAFPDAGGEDRSRFLEWLRVHGRADFGIEFPLPLPAEVANELPVEDEEPRP